MRLRRSARLGSIVLCCLSLTSFGVAQASLYSNGPDAETGYYHVNFGATTTNSFTLSSAATINNVTLTLYTVDDRNPPEHVKWLITTQAFGGQLMASGLVPLIQLASPYQTRFLFYAWQVGIAIPDVNLPAGIYWLQIEDVTTRWNSYAFWAEGNGPSQAYHLEVGSHGAGMATSAVSESFAIYGRWAADEQR